MAKPVSFTHKFFNFQKAFSFPELIKKLICFDLIVFPCNRPVCLTHKYFNILKGFLFLELELMSN